MEYKFEYKDNEERTKIMNEHSDLFLSEERNIQEGNFLIFVDINTYNERQEAQELNSRVSLINQYLTQDTINLSSVEDAILEIEKNKTVNGGM